MPELAECEYFRHKLEKRLVGKTIVQVNCVESGNGPRHGKFDDIVFEKQSVPTKFTFSDALTSGVVQKIQRKGKQIWWEIAKPMSKGMKNASKSSSSSSISALFHLGMTGCFLIQNDYMGLEFKSFQVFDKESNNQESNNDVDGSNDDIESEGYPNVWPPKFTKCEIIFEDDTKVAFRDPRRLGRILLRDDPLMTSPISRLAFDPYTELPSLKTFLQCFEKPKVPIKVLLMDQNRVVCGLGNWLVDEILFQARIHPATKTNLLSESELERIYKSINTIVTTACTCLKDEVALPSNWLFHHRWGKRKRSLISKMQIGKIEYEIKHVTVGGRTSAFIPELQVNPNPPDTEKEISNRKKKSTTALVVSIKKRQTTTGISDKKKSTLKKTLMENEVKSKANMESTSKKSRKKSPKEKKNENKRNLPSLKRSNIKQEEEEEKDGVKRKLQEQQEHEVQEELKERKLHQEDATTITSKYFGDADLGVGPRRSKRCKVSFGKKYI